MGTAGISFIFLSIILLFLLFGYSLISELRIRFAHAVGTRKRAILPTVVVGNLTVGGSGKTPFVQYLSHKLTKNAVLLRGYRRKTKGFIEVNSMHDVLDVGDEALEHFQQELKVFVGENRIEAVEKIHQTDNALELVILDDGLQHVALEPHYGLLLTDYQHPFWNEKFSIPFGKLRQFKSSAHDFDAWVVTKCPLNISKIEMDEIRSKTELPVFFANYKTSELKQCYGAKHPVGEGLKWGLITGIVNGRRLRLTLESRDLNVVRHWEYSDHYLFGKEDLFRWIADSKDEGIVAWICSRKDFMRMKTLLEEIEVDVPIFEVHTEVEILNSEEEVLLNLIKAKTHK
jgi:tetraacyldisaccharide 4'-kinase